MRSGKSTAAIPRSAADHGHVVPPDPAEQAARARAIVNTALDGIITFDEDGRIDSFNPAAEPLFACAAEDALGRDINTFLPDLYREAGEESPGDEGTPGRQKEIVRVGDERMARREDGSRLPVEVTVSEMTLGTRRLFTAFVHDISKRKEVDEALRDYANRLARSNRELQDFASVAAHDLQEPLRKIQAFGDRLQSRCGDLLSEDGRRYLARMHNAATRMRVLIDDLLSFSRVTTRGKPFTRVDLDDVVAGVLSDLEARIESEQGRVFVEPLPTIDADRFQMRQLFQNLIGNGLKFHRDEAPTVSVSARIFTETEDDDISTAGPRDWCRIEVRDNGIGFEQKYVDRIFTIFQRLHARNEYEGTGVGLAICRRIAERHGGRIDARGTPGQGAVFVVTLPVEQAAAGGVP